MPNAGPSLAEKFKNVRSDLDFNMKGIEENSTEQTLQDAEVTNSTEMGAADPKYTKVLDMVTTL